MMTDQLMRMIALARGYRMTEEEFARQRESFAFGNCALHNPNITREMLHAAALRHPPAPRPEA